MTRTGEIKDVLWHVFNRGEMLLDDDDKARETIDQALEDIYDILEKWEVLR